MCHFHAESAKDTLTNLQTLLPETVATVDQFSTQTDRLGRSLEQAHEAYSSRLNMSYPGSMTLQHEGWLWKKGSGLTKSWQRRFFICKDARLYYVHGAEDQDTPQGVLDLLLTSVKPLNDPERRFCFTIISQQKTYTLQALTEWDLQEWMAVIRNNIQFLLDSTEAPAAGPVQPSSFDPRAVNSTCADCGAPGPTWCCINWGVCICIRCSGVHRQMTTSVSKVRSLTLDRLDARLLALIEAIGNARANELLEAERPPDLRLAPDADQASRDFYIRQKYERCAWVPPPSESDIRLAIAAADAPGVLEGIAQARAAGQPLTHLWEAAAFGNPTVCLLIGLNTEALNALDAGGWSALSYAAYHGRLAAAEALLSIGCDPAAAAGAHPYAIALSTYDQGLTRLFQPYWTGGTVKKEEFTPPVPYAEGEDSDSEWHQSRFQTLDLIGIAQRKHLA